MICVFLLRASGVRGLEDEERGVMDDRGSPRGKSFKWSWMSFHGLEGSNDLAGMSLRRLSDFPVTRLTRKIQLTRPGV